MNIVNLILISGVLTAGHWFFLYDHGEAISSETERLRQEIIESDKIILAKKDELQEFVIFDDSVKNLGKEMEAFLKFIPQHLNSRILFEDLTKVANSSAVEIKNINNSPVSKETELYETLNMKLVIEGRFSNFLTFLSGLTALNKIIVIKNIAVRAAPSGQQKGIGAKKIVADLNLTSFRYLNPSALQNEKKKNKKQT